MDRVGGDLGAVKGAGGQSAGSVACAEARARGWPKEARVSLAGRGEAGEMAELGQTLRQPGLAPDSGPGPAELSLSACTSFYPQEQTSSVLAAGEAWREARTFTLHRPAV